MNDDTRTFTLEVMTRSYRKILFWISTLTFIFLATPVILYSLGLRLAPHSWELVQAGGLSIASTPSTGTRIFVDGKLLRETTLFTRRLFLQGLTPRPYYIRIEKEGYFPWEKTLIVEPERVADARALLIKDGSEGTTLLQGEYISFAFADTSESVIKLKNTKKQDVYYSLDDERILPKLNTTGTTTPQLSDAARTVINERAITNFDYDSSLERLLWWDKNKIQIKWLRGNEFLPLYTDKEEAIVFESSEYPIRNAQFYPFEDAALVAYSNAVMVVELDGRDKRNSYPLYKGREPRLLASQKRQTAYILDDGNLIQIPLE